MSKDTFRTTISLPMPLFSRFDALCQKLSLAVGDGVRAAVNQYVELCDAEGKGIGISKPICEKDCSSFRISGTVVQERSSHLAALHGQKIRRNVLSGWSFIEMQPCVVAPALSLASLGKLMLFRYLCRHELRRLVGKSQISQNALDGEGFQNGRGRPASLLQP